jgi:type 1 glutamine amidotransferase
MTMRSVLLALIVAGCSSSSSGVSDAPPIDQMLGDGAIDATCEGTAGAPRILVFSRENLWTHSSTPVARQTFLELCGSHGFSVVASQDPRSFNDRLPTTDVVVFGVTSGEVLDEPSRAAFEAWARAGGGVIGIHAASATEATWPFFLPLIGGTFGGHAEHFTGRTVFENRSHPVLASVPSPELSRFDEWYSFTTHPEQGGVTVLMSLDEQSMPATYPQELRMGYHALTWVHEPFGARVFYTALGHYEDIYAEPWFRNVLVDAVRWAARR